MDYILFSGGCARIPRQTPEMLAGCDPLQINAAAQMLVRVKNKFGQMAAAAMNFRHDR